MNIISDSLYSLTKIKFISPIKYLYCSIKMSEEVDPLKFTPTYNAPSEGSRSKDFFQFKQQKKVEYYKNKLLENEEKEVSKNLNLT